MGIYSVSRSSFCAAPPPEGEEWKWLVFAVYTCLWAPKSLCFQLSISRSICPSIYSENINARCLSSGGYPFTLPRKRAQLSVISLSFRLMCRVCHAFMYLSASPWFVNLVSLQVNAFTCSSIKTFSRWSASLRRVVFTCTYQPSWYIRIYHWLFFYLFFLFTERAWAIMESVLSRNKTLKKKVLRSLVRVEGVCD